MHWTDFGNQFDALNSTEQALFTETVRRLLTQSWVWRDADDDRRCYNFFVRHEEGVTLWLLVTRLIYQEQREQNRTSLHALPLIKVSDLYDRYHSYFPGQTALIQQYQKDAGSVDEGEAA